MTNDNTHEPLTVQRMNEIADRFMQEITKAAFPGDLGCANCTTNIMLMILCKYRLEIAMQRGPLSAERAERDCAEVVLDLEFMFKAAAASYQQAHPNLTSVN